MMFSFLFVKKNGFAVLWGCDASWFDGCHQSTVGTSGPKKVCKGKDLRICFFKLADFEKHIFFHSETQRLSIEPRSLKLWVLQRRWTATNLNAMLPPRQSHKSFSWPKRWKMLTKQRQQMQMQPISLPQFSMSESYRFAPWNILSFSSRCFSQIQIRPRKVSGRTKRPLNVQFIESRFVACLQILLNSACDLIVSSLHRQWMLFLAPDMNRMMLLADRNMETTWKQRMREAKRTI